MHVDMDEDVDAAQDSWQAVGRKPLKGANKYTARL